MKKLLAVGTAFLLVAAMNNVLALNSIPVTAASRQMSPAVMLIGKFDWQVEPNSPTGQPWSRCLDMVWRAVSAGSNRINFVPTHHWMATEDTVNGIKSFCFMHHEVEGDFGSGNICSPWTAAMIAQYRSAMTLCFAEALRQGLTLYIRPHLDDGTANGAWRNGLLLQPEQDYGGFSYYGIMLAPIADALKQALSITAQEGSLRSLPGRNRPVVYFAMQGEMSATVMRYASQWNSVVDQMRATFATGTPADIKLGIGLNFNRLDDTTSVSKTYQSSRLSWLTWQLGLEGSDDQGVPPVDVAGLKQLLRQQLDFVGISAYAPYTGPGMALKEFENAAFMFADEMRGTYGIDILQLIKSGKLELQYSEFGLGAGGSYGGNQMASNPDQVAVRPFFGVYGPYSEARDPWSNVNNRAFLREFYSKALQWLADPSQTTFEISSVFIWSMASWDVLGIYPESTIPNQGSYRDPQIAEAIAAYNKAVLMAQEQAQGHSARNGSLGSSKINNNTSLPQHSYGSIDRNGRGDADNLEALPAQAALG
eukprot:gene13864-13986_t